MFKLTTFKKQFSGSKPKAMQPLEAVLLVDDDEMTHIVNEHLLKQYEVAKKVYKVSNGKQALDFICKRGEYAGCDHPTPDLIFLDINMPVMDGFEFLELFRKIKVEQKEKIVIVLLSGLFNEEALEKATSIGSITMDYSTKPLTQEKIGKLLEEHFDRPYGELSLN